MQDQTAQLSWRNGRVPVSDRFDDPYFSLEDGLAEARHVFLAGNDLPARFASGFHIAELGFGSGLNLLASLEAWAAAGVPGRLRYTAFEAYPMAPDDMARTLAAFSELQPDWLVSAWATGARTVTHPALHLEVIVGDARRTVPTWESRADAWFLDGFAPAKNPELWEPALLRAVFERTAKGGSFATYTAAGAVRRALSDAGFSVERRAGFGRKRHMSAGRRA